MWVDLDPAQIFDQLGSSSVAEGDDCVRAWQAVNESGRQGDAVAFLTAVLGSANERESAAAAAGLWQLLSEMDDTRLRRRRWHPFLWERLSTCGSWTFWTALGVGRFHGEQPRS